MDFNDVLKEIPRQSQRQDSLTDQICDLIKVANKLGMYDAADLLTSVNALRKDIRR